MDNKRLFLAFALSMAIILGFEWLMPKQTPQQARHQETAAGRAVPGGGTPAPATDPLTPGAHPAPVASPGPEHRLPIEAPAVYGSINLVGARLDDLLLHDYRETVSKGSPNVRVLEARSAKQPNLVQVGWSAAPGTTAALPNDDTLWTADNARLTPSQPVTLTWDNGGGLVFSIRIAVDSEYMFDVEQQVRNTTGQPVSLFPWSRVDRGYTPEVTGGYLVHEGPIAVTNGQLKEMSYSSVKSGSNKNGGTAWSSTEEAGARGGWGGITDKYWLTAVLPDRAATVTANYRFDSSDGTYQVDFIPAQAATVPANGTLSTRAHVFAGAKEVHLLERYQDRLAVADFWKAVDFGWFAFLTRPIFYVLDWLNTVLGNFGLALLAFTLIVKTLFFPLAT
ncbi:MAG: membrane protein insertase YidC, partial [Gluconacetobacter diazotrophicus]|nr:membrane protein insertase YidC [Gluconacetobacter diazotrophicus]